MKLKSIMVVAGEISGDIHAAKLLKAVKRKQPDILFFGIGGSELRKLGMEILYDTKDMAVLGFTEVLRKYFFFRTVFRHMLAVAKERKPDAVLLVDYPGFNMRFATYVHALGLKIIYYICPQVWAWHRSRIFKMAQTVDRLITIFPFEKDFFRNTSLPVDFVGHPLIAKTSELLAAPEINLPWTGSPHVALLPGSRYQEVKRILPVMCNAAYFVQQKFPAASFIVAVPSDEIRAYAQTVLAHTEAGKVDLQVITDETLHVLRQAHAAIVASGTATLEAALMRCPVVITYKVSFPTYPNPSSFKAW